MPPAETSSHRCETPTTPINSHFTQTIKTFALTHWNKGMIISVLTRRWRANKSCTTRCTFKAYTSNFTRNLYCLKRLSSRRNVTTFKDTLRGAKNTPAQASTHLKDFWIIRIITETKTTATIKILKGILTRRKRCGLNSIPILGTLIASRRLPTIMISSVLAKETNFLKNLVNRAKWQIVFSLITTDCALSWTTKLFNRMLCRCKAH